MQPQISLLMEDCYRHLLAAVYDCELPRTHSERRTRMFEHTDRGRFSGQIIDPSTLAVSVNIARAGTLPSHVCFQSLNQLLDPVGVRQDHLIMERVTDRDGVVCGASLQGSKIGGSVDKKILFVPDPMAATGSSLIQALGHYRDEIAGTPRLVVAVHLIVTPEYVKAMTAAFPETHIHAIRVDRGLSEPDIFDTVPGTHWDREKGLNEKQYIVPGGGGFGEIMNNTDA